MGFLKKIFKGVKKVFKKIGKAIKRTFKKIGKFMGKLGIVGQIGLAFLLPGIGGLLGKAATSLGAMSNPLMQGVGKILQTAVNFGKTAGKVFSTVTDAVGGFVKEVGGGFLSKMGVSDATLAKMGMNPEGGFQSWMDGVGKSVGAVRDSASGIFDPWKTDTAGLNFHERSLAEIAAKKGELKPVSIDPTKDPMDPQYQQTKLKTDTQQYSKDPMSPNYDPVEAAEAVMEETAKAQVEQNKSLVTSFTDQLKQVPGKIGSNVISSLETAGTNYINQTLGIMPQTQQVETYSGGTAQITPVDTTPQLAQFMQPFQMGTVNTNYNALFDQIYGVA